MGAAPRDFRTAPDEFQGTPDGFRTAPDDFQDAPGDFRAAPRDFQGAPGDFRTAPAVFRTAPDGFGGAPDDFRDAPGGGKGRPARRRGAEPGVLTAKDAKNANAEPAGDGFCVDRVVPGLTAGAWSFAVYPLLSRVSLPILKRIALVDNWATEMAMQLNNPVRQAVINIILQIWLLKIS